MRFTISQIEQQMGVPVFSGLLEEGPLTVGDDVELVASDEVRGSGMICGVLVEGRALDRAEAGSAIQCTIRGAGFKNARVGDRVRSPIS